MKSEHSFPFIYVEPQKRLPASTPQGRAEQSGTGTQVEGRGEGAVGELEE